MDGRVDVLWQQKHRNVWIPWGVPSPNGRFLAIAGGTEDSNMWLLENF
jgi:hypothetical protein